MILFFLLILSILVYLFYSLRKNKFEVQRYWSKGLVPPDLSYEPDNLTLIYIAIAGLLLREQPAERHHKQNLLYKFILNQINRDYPAQAQNQFYQEIKGTLTYSMQHPIKLESVCKWFLIHRISDGHKQMLFKFFTEFASIDKKINPGELAILKELARRLSYPERQLNIMIDAFAGRNRSSSQNRHQKQSRASTATSMSDREKYCKVLGIPKESTFAEIRKSYRKLVLLYHPDKFVNAPKSEYDSAQKRFLEIQSAYEKLEKMK